jgi:hypothetical protein
LEEVLQCGALEKWVSVPSLGELNLTSVYSSDATLSRLLRLPIDLGYEGGSSRNHGSTCLHA